MVLKKFLLNYNVTPQYAPLQGVGYITKEVIICS